MANENNYDIAIVGGGLAGLCTAVQAANAGYKVIVFEKEEYPFHKVCGEYISLESWDFLERLGLDLNALNLPIIHQLQISAVSGRVYDFALPMGGFGISRYTLDMILYQLALQKGVTVATNTKVQDIFFEDEQFIIHAGNKTYTAVTAAGSFGKRSNLDVKWNRSFILDKPGKLNNYIGVKYHIRLKHAIDTIALHNFKDGYCGMSAIENGSSCLCYLTTAKNLQVAGNSIQQLEQTVLFKNPQLKKIFTEAEFLYEKPLTISQVSFHKKTQVENHVLLIGDAAGMITPLCGNGMSMAMHGSKLAFENIHLFMQHTISRQTLESRYTQHWETEFSKRLWMGRTVQRLFGNNTSTSIFLRAMKGLPFLSNSIIKSTHGESF